MTLQIREGAYYKRRDGQVVGPATPIPTDYGMGVYYPWTLSSEFYTNDGRYNTWNAAGTSTDPLDLINEVRWVDVTTPELANTHVDLPSFKEPRLFVGDKGSTLWLVGSRRDGARHDLSLEFPPEHIAWARAFRDWLFPHGSETPALPTPEQKAAQGAACGCAGTDDYCTCQNVAKG